MDCREYQEDLTAYIDGELAPSRAAEIKTHVQYCRPCNDELDGLKESVLFLEANTRELELNPLLWRNVRAQISASAKPARPAWLPLLLGHRWAAGAVTLAAAFALALGAWNYYERRADEQRLREYMNEYVHSRETQEIQERQRPYRRTTGATDVIVPDHMENPFVTVRPVSFENPFRSEAR